MPSCSVRTQKDGMTVAPLRSANSIGPVGISASSPKNGREALGPSMSRSATRATTPPWRRVWMARLTPAKPTGAMEWPLLARRESTRRESLAGWRGSVRANTFTPLGNIPWAPSSGLPRWPLITITPFPAATAGSTYSSKP